MRWDIRRHAPLMCNFQCAVMRLLDTRSAVKIVWRNAHPPSTKKVIPVLHMKACEGSRCTVPLILHLGAWCRRLVTPRPLYARGNIRRSQLSRRLGGPQNRSACYWRRLLLDETVTGRDGYCRRLLLEETYWRRLLLDETVTGWDCYRRRLTGGDCYLMRLLLDETVTGWDCYWRRLLLEETVTGGDSYWRRLLLEETVTGGDCYWMRLLLDETYWMRLLVEETVTGGDCYWRRLILEETDTGWDCYWRRLLQEEIVTGGDCYWMRLTGGDCSGGDSYWRRLLPLQKETQLKIHLSPSALSNLCIWEGVVKCDNQLRITYVF